MAERKISTKFAIQGESEYKQAVKSINQEMKVLNSEMAKTASEFSNAQNSMDALAAKADVLGKQYEAQAQRVETMREALENAKTAQQEWADKQEEASSRVEELNRQMEELKQTEGDTAEEQARLAKELEDANAALDYANKGYEAASKGVEDWQIRLNYAEADLNRLDGQIEENNRLMEEAKNSADGCATSIDQYGKAVSQTAEASDSMGNIGAQAFSKIAGAITSGGVIGFCMTLLNTIKEIAVETKNAEVIMVRGTGAQGEALRELNDIYMDVMANAKSSSDAVAASIAVLNTRAGLTGDKLKKATAATEEFARIGGVNADAAANSVINMLNAFGKSADELDHAYDLLTKASQMSGASVTQLAEATANSAYQAQSFGISMEGMIARVAASENAVTGLSNVMTRGLRKSFTDITEGGKTWQQIEQQIKDGTLSTAEATDLFGNKAAELANYIRNGTMDIDRFVEAMGEVDGTLHETAETSETFKEKWKGLWNDFWYSSDRGGTAMSGFYELREEVTETAAAVDEKVVPSFEQAAEKLKDIGVNTDFTSESIGTMIEYLNSEDAAVLRSAEGYDELVESLYATQNELASLEAATEKAAEGVQANLDNMMGRFNEVPYTVEQSTVSVISALQTQMTYMETYASNMQKAASRGVDEGLLKSLSDGSAESAQILAGLVDATDGEIQVLNEKWNQTQAGKENFSRTMAEIQTDFDQKAGELEARYDEAVASFDDYAEAQAAGAHTIQGAMDGAAKMATPLYNSYYSMGQQSARQFAAGFQSIPAPNPNKGYAAGTLSAAPGWAWTGETGPELILFRGGETVLNHEESMRLTREAMAAALAADNRNGSDLSSPIVVSNVQSSTDVRTIEGLIMDVIEAVKDQKPIEFPAIVSGVDRQLARQRTLIEQAGG